MFRWQEEWPEGYQMAAAMKFEFPAMPATPIETVVNTASKDGLSSLMEMLEWNPEKRPSAMQVIAPDTPWALMYIWCDHSFKRNLNR